MDKISLLLKTILLLCLLGAFEGAANECRAQAPITNGLAHRWPFDGNLKDSAGNTDGTPAGKLSFVLGGKGNAVQFGDAQAAVEFTPDTADFGTQDFTIACWIKTSSDAPMETFLDKRPTCDIHSSLLEIRIGCGPGLAGVPLLGLASGQEGPDHLTLPATRKVNDGQWHHLAWVRESSSSGSAAYLVFIDGALDAATNLPFAANVHNAKPLVMGQGTCQCCDGLRPYSGAARELQIFTHALTAPELFKIYNAGKATQTPPAAGQ